MGCFPQMNRKVWPYFLLSVAFLFAAIKFYHPTDAYKFRPVRVAYLCGAQRPACRMRNIEGTSASNSGSSFASPLGSLLAITSASREPFSTGNMLHHLRSTQSAKWSDRRQEPGTPAAVITGPSSFRATGTQTPSSPDVFTPLRDWSKRIFAVFALIVIAHRKKFICIF